MYAEHILCFETLKPNVCIRGCNSTSIYIYGWEWFVHDACTEGTSSTTTFIGHAC